jgi:hypothetical protein
MIELLKLYDIKSPKIRLGNDCDGGYVIPQILLDHSNALFSYGVGSDISFEIDFVKHSNKPSFSYDHTCNEPAIPDEYKNLMVFKKEGLSHKKEEQLDSFFSHYNESGINGEVFLKMDIEEAEFEYFLNTNIKDLSEIVTGMVVEFHPLNREKNWADFFEIVEKLNEYFYHCHLHGNNYAGASVHTEYGMDFILPHVMEMTFINKKFIKEDDVTLDMSDYPNPEYDRKNEWAREDHSLSFLKDINNLKP